MDDAHDPVRALAARQAAQWLVEQGRGALPPQRERDFLRWLRLSPLHLSEYLRMGALEQRLGEATRLVTTPLDRLVADARAAEDVTPLFGQWAGLEFRPRRAERPARPRRHAAWTWAAACLVVATIAVGVLPTLTAPREQVFTTLHGEHRTWRLSDGSTLRMNTDSELAVRYGAGRREIEIRRGQAYFDVAADPRPFQVRAGTSLIEDIGTAFDVYRQNGDTVVTVVHGEVALWESPPRTDLLARWLGRDALRAPAARHLADLDAGMQARIGAGGALRARGSVDAERAVAWIRDEIAFDDTPIAEVAAQFDRYSRTPIRVETPEVAAMRISGVFKTGDVDSFVLFLDSLPGVRSERVDRQVVVRARR